MKKQFIQVLHLLTDLPIYQVEVTGKNVRQTEKVNDGLLAKIDLDKFYTEYTETEYFEGMEVGYLSGGQYPQYGKIKGFCNAPDNEGAYVVFSCAGQWDRFREYTGNLCAYTFLVPWAQIENYRKPTKNEET
jgi:hypothetical protein